MSYSDKHLSLLRNIWFVLLGLTIGSYLLLDQIQGQIVFSMASGIAGIKVMLILHYFMEVKETPSAFKLLVYAWVIALVCVISLMPWIHDLMAQFGLLIEIEAH